MTIYCTGGQVQRDELNCGQHTWNGPTLGILIVGSRH